MVNEDQVVREKTKRLPTSWSSEYQAVYYELDKSALLCRDEQFLSKDSVVYRHQISDRQKLTIASVSLPILKEFLVFDRTGKQNVENKRIKQTQELSVVKIPLIDYNNFLHVTAFEKTFDHAVGFKAWSFRDRAVWEDVTADQFSQVLSECLRVEPEVVAFVDKQTDCLHLAFFFKSVPGRILYKQWEAAGAVVPSFDTYLGMDAASQAKRSYLHLAEDDVGRIKEKRVMVMPADNSRVDVRVATAFYQQRPRVTVHKRDVILGIGPAVEQDGHTLKEIVRRETTSTINKSVARLDEIEEIEQDQSDVAPVSHREDDGPKPEKSADVMIDEKVTSLRNHINSSCEFFINFDNNPRLLFETSLLRVDQ